MDSPSAPPTRQRIDPVLAAIVLAAAVGGTLILAKARNWAVMTDELLYTGMSRSVANSIIPLPQVRGEAIGYRQILFPTLIAPFVGTMRMPAAYPWIAALNALLYASAAIPAYLIAHRVTLSRAAARWVAACTVVTPWLAFASKAIPDVTAFVAVLWFAYALIRTAGASERPLKGDLLTLLALVLAYLARTQFLLLVGVWLGAVVLIRAAAAARDGGAREIAPELLRLPLRRPLPFAAFALVLIFYLFDRSGLLAGYTAAATASTSAPAPGGLPHALLNHASVVALGLAGLPFVLGLPWLATALARYKDARQLDAAVVIVLLAGAIIYVAASFDLRYSETDRVIERYVFYFAPLMLVAMAAFFSDPPKNLIAFAVPAVLGILLLNVSQPYGVDDKLAIAINQPFSPTQIALVVYQRAADAVGTSIFGLMSLVMIALATAALLLVRGGRAPLARDGSFALLLIVLLAASGYAVPKIVSTQNELVDEIYGKRTNDQKAWIEQATGGAPVSLAYSARTDALSAGQIKQAERASNWWDLVFWNGNVSAIYAPVSAARPRSIFPGAVHPLLPDWRTGKLTRWSGDDSEYLVQAASDPNYAPQFGGEPVRRGGYVLRETGRDATAAWATQGLTLRGWIPPRGATLRVYAPRGASGPSKVRMSLAVATTSRPPSFAGFRIEGAKAVAVGDGRRRATYSWTATIPAGGHRDFELVRGPQTVHVEGISAR